MEIESGKFTQTIKIKSPYIFQRVFSFLCEKIKLSHIKAIKKIQKKSNIDIEYYRKIIHWYRIIKEIGKGQEFLINTKFLIFKGEYKKGKKQG